MYQISMQEPSMEFARCWQSAGLHLQRQGVKDNWLKADLAPPFLEHLSFRLGNQLFYVLVEDVDGRVNGPGSLDGLLSIADGCGGHPCLMPMRCSPDGWAPDLAGWGLQNARTGEAVNPPGLISEELIEMTDWEVHDFAVQVVRDWLKGEGRQLMSSQGNPQVDPSIWFVGEHGPEWVVVRAVRYPAERAQPPANWKSIADRCRRLSARGRFASVAVANADGPFDGKGDPAPLWRGHGMQVRFEGLVPGVSLVTEDCR